MATAFVDYESSLNLSLALVDLSMYILADQFLQIKPGFGVPNLVPRFQRITPAAGRQGQLLFIDDAACLDRRNGI